MERPEPIRLRFDGTINLAMVAAFVGLLVTAGAVYGGIAARLEAVERTLSDVAVVLAVENNNRSDIDALRDDLREMRRERP